MSETRELIERARDVPPPHPILDYRESLARRLAAVCEVLLAAHPERECAWVRLNRPPCTDAKWMCQPCRDRALLERCDRAARGGE